MRSAEPQRFYSILFWTSCLAFVLLFVYFYPPIYAFRDEGIYLSLAEVFKKGTVFIEKTGIPISIYIDRNGHHMPFYPPGNPLLLIPFSWLGTGSMFMLGLSFHILGAFLFRKLARIFDCDYPSAFLLYLFFPSFVFYSRTIMSDIPSLALFLGAYYFYYRQQSSKAWAGALFGLSLFFRVSNVIVILPFALGLLIKALREKKWGEFLAFCATAAPFAAAMGIYNQIIYGSPLLSGYSSVFTGVKNFSASFLKANAMHYLTVLNTVYPFMMLLFLFSKRVRRIETVFLTLFLFVFFGFYYFQERYPQASMVYVFGNRFFYPIIPFFIMAFADQLQNLLKHLHVSYQKGTAAILALCLILGSGFIHFKHQTYLEQQTGYRDFIYKNSQEGDALIYDGTVAELIQAAWGKRYYIPFEGFARMQAGINLLPPETDTYLVVRKTSHGTTNIAGVLSLALDTIRTSYKFDIAAESEAITLYKLRRSGN